MTPEENALLARLDGWDVCEKGAWRKINEFSRLDPPDYDDERNLMPLAWKHGVSVYFQDTGVCVVFTRLTREAVVLPEEFKEAIQQALLAIAREKYGE